MKIPAELQGDVECPVASCDIEGSALYAKDHFHNWHQDYEKQHAVVTFLTDAKEWSSYVDTGDLADIDVDTFSSVPHDEILRSSLKQHPVFTEDFVLALFESIDDAVDYGSRSLTDNMYSPSLHEYELIRYKSRKEDATKKQTHDIYGSDWGEIKWSILQRDGFVCRLCNESVVKENTVNPHNKHLDVHHITPAREFESRDEMNDPSNLITLCRSCHGTHEGEHTGATADEWPALVRNEDQVIEAND